MKNKKTESLDLLLNDDSLYEDDIELKKKIIHNSNDDDDEYCVLTDPKLQKGTGIIDDFPEDEDDDDDEDEEFLDEDEEELEDEEDEKDVLDEDEDEDEDEIEETPEIDDNIVNIMKKKRGRPAKVVAEVKPKIQEPSTEPKKKRGRPKKETPVQPETTKVESNKNDNVSAPKKRKGRPRIHPVVVVDPEKQFDVPLRFSPEKGLSHIEFEDHEYRYNKIMNPDGELTSYYSCFYRNIAGKNTWVPMRGLLTNNYKIVNLEKFIGILQSDVKIKNPVLNSSSPFLLAWTGETKKNIEVFSDNIDKDIFNMLTGIEDDIELKSNIHIVLINSYNGSTTLRVNFIINTFGKSGKTKVDFTDYFTLGNKSYRIIHAGNINNIIASIDKIEEEIEDNISALKDYNKNINKIIDKVIDTFTFKHIRDNFRGAWEGLASSQKNAFYMLLLTSKYLGENYNIQLHLNLSHIINKYINEAIKSYEK